MKSHSKVVATTDESPRGIRDRLYSLVPTDFNPNGLATTPQGVVWTQAAILLAIGEFNRRAQQIDTYAGIAIKVQAVGVGGSLARGNARLGIYPPAVTFNDALRVQDAKVAARGAFFTRGHDPDVRAVLDYPSDIDLQIVLC